jgi:hypothetical protein
MVLVLETISKEDFNRGYSIKGNLNGDYKDVTDYLTWVLNTSRVNNDEHLKLVINTLTKRFMPYVTTKYLRSFIESKTASERLHHLLLGAGYTTEPVKSYCQGLRCIVSQTNNLIFGQGVLLGTKVSRVSRVSRVFIGRVLHKVITQKEADEKANRLREQANKLLLKEDLNRSIIGFYPTYSGDYGCSLETTARQEKAIRKLQDAGKFISLNCKECKHHIRLPLTPNLETNKSEMLMSGIYSYIANDIEAGNYLCGSCKVKREKMLNENYKFDYSAILNQLEQMKNSIIGDSRCFSIPTLSFMMEFYREIGLPSLEKVQKILSKASESLNFKTLITLETIKIKFN